MREMWHSWWKIERREVLKTRQRRDAREECSERERERVCLLYHEVRTRRVG